MQPKDIIHPSPVESEAASLFGQLAARMGAMLSDPETVARHRLRETDFTRERAMPFRQVAIFILAGAKCSTENGRGAFSTWLTRAPKAGPRM
jgi:hypothetical protein